MAAEGFRDRVSGLFRRRDETSVAPPDGRAPDAILPVLPAFGSGPGAGPGPGGDDSEDARTARALDALRDAVRAAGRQLPTVLSSRLRHMDDLLRSVLATVVAQGASSEQRYLLDAMISDYIADPLRTYLGLPDADRTDGSPATVMFAEQLGVLEETILDMHNQIRIGAISELSAHGRFLADKFAGPDAGLTLGGPR